VEQAYEMMQKVKADFDEPGRSDVVVERLRTVCKPVFASIESKYSAHRREIYKE